MMIVMLITHTNDNPALLVSSTASSVNSPKHWTINEHLVVQKINGKETEILCKNDGVNAGIVVIKRHQ